MELVQPLDFDLKLLTDEFSQSGDLERGSRTDHVTEFTIGMTASEVVQRTLQLLQKVCEHRPHGAHDVLGILARGCLHLELFRLGVAELELLHNGFCEVGSADRECPDPATPLIGDDHIRGHRPDVDVDDRI